MNFSFRRLADTDLDDSDVDTLNNALEALEYFLNNFGVKAPLQLENYNVSLPGDGGASSTSFPVKLTGFTTANNTTVYSWTAQNFGPNFTWTDSTQAGFYNLYGPAGLAADGSLIVWISPGYVDQQIGQTYIITTAAYSAALLVTGPKSGSYWPVTVQHATSSSALKPGQTGYLFDLNGVDLDVGQIYEGVYVGELMPSTTQTVGLSTSGLGGGTMTSVTTNNIRQLVFYTQSRGYAAINETHRKPKLDVWGDIVTVGDVGDTTIVEILSDVRVVRVSSIKTQAGLTTQPPTDSGTSTPSVPPSFGGLMGGTFTSISKYYPGFVEFYDGNNWQDKYACQIIPLNTSAQLAPGLYIGKLAIPGSTLFAVASTSSGGGGGTIPSYPETAIVRMVGSQTIALGTSPPDSTAPGKNTMTSTGGNAPPTMSGDAIVQAWDSTVQVWYDTSPCLGMPIQPGMILETGNKYYLGKMVGFDPVKELPIYALVADENIAFKVNGVVNGNLYPATVSFFNNKVWNDGGPSVWIQPFNSDESPALGRRLTGWFLDLNDDGKPIYSVISTASSSWSLTPVTLSSETVLSNRSGYRITQVSPSINGGWSTTLGGITGTAYGPSGMPTDGALVVWVAPSYHDVTLGQTYVIIAGLNSAAVKVVSALNFGLYPASVMRPSVSGTLSVEGVNAFIYDMNGGPLENGQVYDGVCLGVSTTTGFPVYMTQSRGYALVLYNASGSSLGTNISMPRRPILQFGGELVSLIDDSAYNSTDVIVNSDVKVVRITSSTYSISTAGSGTMTSTTSIYQAFVQAYVNQQWIDVVRCFVITLGGTGQLLNAQYIGKKAGIDLATGLTVYAVQASSGGGASLSTSSTTIVRLLDTAVLANRVAQLNVGGIQGGGQVIQPPARTTNLQTPTPPQAYKAVTQNYDSNAQTYVDANPCLVISTQPGVVPQSVGVYAYYLAQLVGIDPVLVLPIYAIVAPTVSAATITGPQSIPNAHAYWPSKLACGLNVWVNTSSIEFVPEINRTYPVYYSGINPDDGMPIYVPTYTPQIFPAQITGNNGSNLYSFKELVLGPDYVTYNPLTSRKGTLNAYGPIGLQNNNLVWLAPGGQDSGGKQQYIIVSYPSLNHIQSIVNGVTTDFIPQPILAFEGNFFTNAVSNDTNTSARTLVTIDPLNYTNTSVQILGHDNTGLLTWYPNAGQFIEMTVMAELDDYLICQNNGVNTNVAKPRELRKYPWNTTSRTLWGKTMTYTYSGVVGQRFANSDTGDSETQLITPQYFTNDRIIAVPMVITLVSGTVQYIDLNNAGRAWASYNNGNTLSPEGGITGVVGNAP